MPESFLSSLNEADLTAFGLDTLEDDYQKYILNRRLCTADVATWKELVGSLVALGFSPTDVEQLKLLLVSIILLNSVRFLPASPARSDVPVNNRIRMLAYTNTDSPSTKENTPAVDMNGATAMIHPEDLEKGKSQFLGWGCIQIFKPTEPILLEGIMRKLSL
ncbi:unnamed protein product [Echinostoma caproni]|uniref:Uncharacterized protein n=1 Tax=Echinostoma caproni TaxID=27848 RepID=A0A183AYG5_9TREM|nr:unnamed protein product [Echinostoma caproni]